MITDEQGKAIEVEEKVKTDAKGHLATIMVGDKEYKVINTTTVIEIVAHQLESGQELQQVIAHEFMMADHKQYMVKVLTDAINTVMKAKKRKPTIAVVGSALANKLKRQINVGKQGAFGRR